MQRKTNISPLLTPVSSFLLPEKVITRSEKAKDLRVCEFVPWYLNVQSSQGFLCSLEDQN